MSPGELVGVVADALGIQKNQMIPLDRATAEAGFRTSGGRGASAPRMAPRDAAYVLLTVLCRRTELMAKTVERVAAVHNLKLTSSRRWGTLSDRPMPCAPVKLDVFTFSEAIEHLLGDGFAALDEWIKTTDRKYEIHVNLSTKEGAIRFYEGDQFCELSYENSEKPDLEFTTSKRISSSSLIRISHAFKRDARNDRR